MKVQSIVCATLALCFVGGAERARASETTDAASSTPTASASTALATLAQLPDWSGTWSLTEASRDTGFAGRRDLRAILTPKYAAQLPAPPSEGVQLARSGDGPPSSANPPPPGALKPVRGGGANSKWRNNLLQCAPPGFPGDMAHPYAHEYLFTPGRVTILIEDGEARRVFTDGRGHLPPAQLYHTLVGDSIGHWEGATLVVDTVGMRPEAELLAGLHATRTTHIVEHIHKTDEKTLEIETTITDPAMFTRPMDYKLFYERVPGQLMENDCALDQRDNDQSLDLTPPPAEQ